MSLDQMNNNVTRRTLLRAGRYASGLYPGHELIDDCCERLTCRRYVGTRR